MPETNAEKLLAEIYDGRAKALAIVLDHGRRVAEKALLAAAAVDGEAPDLDFVFEAAILHDAGILFTHAPDIGCHGDEPYIRHGIIGARLLEQRGLSRHARVCERHIGTGITALDVVSRGLPLPERDMVPETLEEVLVCYADKFFSKNGAGKAGEKPPEEIVRGLARFGREKAETFLDWHRRFGGKG